MSYGGVPYAVVYAKSTGGSIILRKLFLPITPLDQLTVLVPI
jgi:hypothetical protein